MKAKILGINVNHTTMDQAIAQVAGFISEPKPHLVVTVNSEMIMLANKDTVLYEIINRADLVVPDGVGVVWASKFLGTPLPERVPGVELMQRLVEESLKHNWRIYMLGAEPGVAEQAAKTLTETYPSVNIVGTHHGYFTKAEEPDVLAKIKVARPDILFVALGVPKQEKWAAAHLARLEIPVAIGVGGSFEIFAGVTDRAPKWMRSHGLEWFYRLCKQPWRAKRMQNLPQFVVWVLIERTLVRRDEN